MLLALPTRRAQLHARAVRDHLADLEVTLPALLDQLLGRLSSLMGEYLLQQAAAGADATADADRRAGDEGGAGDGLRNGVGKLHQWAISLGRSAFWRASSS